MERHFGEEVVVHRKGATSASDGEVGIIPGSMGTNSYIVRGKGSADSFASCSHGAGRVMSRTAARKTIAQGDFERALSNTFTRAARGYIDEAPQSYKDVDEVVRRQADLVDATHVLRPIITLKGDSKARDD
jgi:tRNA-splicing ligase RtcB